MIISGQRVLSLLNVRAFGTRSTRGLTRAQKKFKERTDDIVDKVKMKKTVADMKNIKSFMNESINNSELRSNVTRSAQYDPEFRDFLKKFNEKHKEYPNYVDVTHYMQTQDVFQKTPEMREEELTMLEEFRRRRKEREGFLNQKLTDIAQDEDEDGGSWDDYGLREDLRPEALLKRGATRIPADFEMTGGDFMGMLLYTGSTTLVTTLNRINHYRVLLFAGNMNGIIGYGKGKALDMEEAMVKANHSTLR